MLKSLMDRDNYLMLVDRRQNIIIANGFHKEENMANPLALHFYNALKQETNS